MKYTLQTIMLSKVSKLHMYIKNYRLNYFKKLNEKIIFKFKV